MRNPLCFFRAVFLLLCTLTFSANSLPAGVIAYYPLNNDLNDYSGHGNNGTAYGGPVWVTGHSGNALYFDGINDYVSIPDNGSLNITNQLSISAWIKPEKGNMWYRIVGKSNTSQTQNTWLLGIAMNGGVYFSVFTASGQYYTNCSQGIPMGTWSHLVGTWDGATLHAYLNGVVQPEQVTVTGPVLSSTGPLLIGEMPGGSYYFQGAIDEIMIFNRALSQSEVTGLYNNPPQVSNPFLIPVPSPSVNRRPTLFWHPVPQAAAYEIQIDTTMSFINPIIKTSLLDTTYKVPVDLPIDTIYWKVIAGINDSTMYYSEIGSFIIQDPRIPILIPYEPKVTQERKPVLAWNTVTGASTYFLEAATNSLFSNLILIVPQAETHYAATVEFPFGTIYWRVKSDLLDKWSIPDTFQIQPDSIPFLIRFNGATLSTKRPLFQWHSVINAGSYRIEIAANRSFSENYTTIPVNDTFYVPLADMAPGTWFWHVSCGRNFQLFSPVDSLVIPPPDEAIRGEKSAAPHQGIRIITADKYLGIIPDRAFTGKTDIRIYSISGKCMYRGIGNDGMTVVKNIFPAGLYIVEVNEGERCWKGKMMIRGK